MRRISKPQKYKLFILNNTLKAIIKLKKSPHKKTFYRRYLILRRRFYGSKEWKALSRLVKQRAGFRCKLCGNGNTRIDAHHIQPIFYFPELGLCIENIICLCRDCHRNIHKEAHAA